MEEEFKQAIIVRADLKMSKGKLAAQCAHASLMGYFEVEKTAPEVAKAWIESGEKKIVLKVQDEASLKKLYGAFRFKKVPCALVTDAGLTELSPGTKTALGVGPWYAKEIDQFALKLKLL